LSGSVRWALGNVDGGLRPALEAQFCQDGRHVVFDGLLGKEQFIADLPVGQPLADQGQHFLLLRAQALQPGIGGSRGQARDDLLLNSWFKQGFTRSRPADPGQEVIAPDLFQDVSGRAGQDCTAEGLFVVVTGEDQAAEAGIEGTHVPAHLDSRTIGEPSVEDGNVGVQRRNTTGGLGCGPAFAHHQEPFTLQQVLQPLPDKFMVVKDEHADLPG
jgi:hypothetical protein